VKLKRRFPSLFLITINKIGGHERDIDGFIRGHKGDNDGVFMYPQKH
jgi:hypothetical protein